MVKLEAIYLMNVALYFDTTKNLKLFMSISHTCKEAVGMLHIIPYKISDTKPTRSFLERLSRFLPHLQTLKCNLTILNEIPIPQSVVYISGVLLVSRDNDSVIRWMGMCSELYITTHHYSRVDLSVCKALRILHILISKESVVSSVFDGEELAHLPVLHKIVVECFGSNLEEVVIELEKNKILQKKEIICKLHEIENVHISLLNRLNQIGVVIGIYSNTLEEIPGYVILLHHFGYLTITSSDDTFIENLHHKYIRPLNLHILCNQNIEHDIYSVNCTSIHSLIISGLNCLNKLIIPTSLNTLKLHQCSLPPLNFTYVCLENVTIESCSIDSLTLPVTVSSLTCIHSIIHTIPNLHKLNLPLTKLISIAHTLSYPMLPTNINDVTFSSAPILSFPNITSCSLHKFKLFRCNELKTLTIPTTITMLAICSCKILTSIDTNLAQLKKLELTDNPVLKSFSCPSTMKSIFVSRNKLLNLSFASTLRKIKAIQTFIPPIQLNALSRLSLSGCNELQYNQYTSLQYLTITSQLTQNLTFPSLLQNLSITDCQCDSIDIKTLTHLTALTLWKCPKINELELPNFIQKVDIARCGKLIIKSNEQCTLRDLKIVQCEIQPLVLPKSICTLTYSRSNTIIILNKSNLPNLIVKPL
ncbi:hypothetical protein EDI_138800 [Entamoeba dispar SAW760]|uniref:Leucine-rich repeat containing protein n=1 Tax=Entamoeba dispar (strain ATCC PRA-260 / SAW760) TaxID=370354 RepID=B0EIH1_ENTDS|nr:uncharacterized protein EDI_138800 [Entamoeba dispar SAW760]EDR25700.1 hypothetical protein EDI_138800 [Entamoeba dispar SAW760]|eukprot:EDR25700.1 hypothetical protein EDI_138800 [Entamoeba dispar SAW760]